MKYVAAVGFLQQNAAKWGCLAKICWSARKLMDGPPPGREDNLGWLHDLLQSFHNLAPL